MKLNTSTVTLTRPANTDAYAAKDLIANSTTVGQVTPLTFSNLANTRAGTGYITKAILWVDGATFTAPIRLHLFKEAPSVASLADNAQYPLTFAESDKYIGYIDFVLFTAAGTGSDVSFAEIDDIRMAVESDDLTGSNPIYGLLVAQGAFTPTSGQRFKVVLSCDAYEF